MTDKIVDSFNIFVDTDQGSVNSSSNGVDYELNLGNSKIDIRKGQHFKVSLLNFNMYKTFTNVNRYNSDFVIKTTTQDPITLSLPHVNHQTIRTIIDDFGLIMKGPLLVWAQEAGSNADGVNVEVISPSATATLEGKSDNIIRFKIKFTQGGSPTNHNISGLKIQFFTQLANGMCDTYSLLGGDRIRGKLDATSNDYSYDVDETTVATEISFAGFYHAQKSTEAFVYLHHSLGASTKTLETSSLNEANLTRGNISEVHSSSILAKVAIDTEFIHFDSLTGGNEYFMNLYNMKHLNNIRFSVKNSHGAPIQSLGFADAATIGNLNFSMVLKVDIVERTTQDEVHLGVLDRGIDPKKSNLSYNTTF